jgi:hypothetical protein
VRAQTRDLRIEADALAQRHPQAWDELSPEAREGLVARPGIFEPFLRHTDGMRAAMPLADKPSTRLQCKARIWTHSACGAEHLCQRLQLAAGRLTKPTVLKLVRA